MYICIYIYIYVYIYLTKPHTSNYFYRPKDRKLKAKINQKP